MRRGGADWSLGTRGVPHDADSIVATQFPSCFVSHAAATRASCSDACIVAARRLATACTTWIELDDGSADAEVSRAVRSARAACAAHVDGIMEEGKCARAAEARHCADPVSAGFRRLLDERKAAKYAKKGIPHVKDLVAATVGRGTRTHARALLTVPMPSSMRGASSARIATSRFEDVMTTEQMRSARLGFGTKFKEPVFSAACGLGNILDANAVFETCENQYDGRHMPEPNAAAKGFFCAVRGIGLLLNNSVISPSPARAEVVDASVTCGGLNPVSFASSERRRVLYTVAVSAHLFPKSQNSTLVYHSPSTGAKDSVILRNATLNVKYVGRLVPSSSGSGQEWNAAYGAGSEWSARSVLAHVEADGGEVMPGSSDAFVLRDGAVTLRRFVIEASTMPDKNVMGVDRAFGEFSVNIAVLRDTSSETNGNVFFDDYRYGEFQRASWGNVTRTAPDRGTCSFAFSATVNDVRHPWEDVPLMAKVDRVELVLPPFNTTAAGIEVSSSNPEKTLSPDSELVVYMSYMEGTAIFYPPSTAVVGNRRRVASLKLQNDDSSRLVYIRLADGIRANDFSGSIEVFQKAGEEHLSFEGMIFGRVGSGSVVAIRLRSESVADGGIGIEWDLEQTDNDAGGIEVKEVTRREDLSMALIGSNSSLGAEATDALPDGCHLISGKVKVADGLIFAGGGSPPRDPIPPKDVGEFEVPAWGYAGTSCFGEQDDNLPDYRVAFMIPKWSVETGVELRDVTVQADLIPSSLTVTHNINGILHGRMPLENGLMGLPPLRGWATVTMPFFATGDQFQATFASGFARTTASVALSVGDPSSPIVKLDFLANMDLPCVPPQYALKEAPGKLVAELGIMQIDANVGVNIPCNGAENVDAGGQIIATTVMNPSIYHVFHGERLEMDLPLGQLKPIKLTAKWLRGTNEWYFNGTFIIEVSNGDSFLTTVTLELDTEEGLPVGGFLAIKVHYSTPKLEIKCEGSFPLGPCVEERGYTLSGEVLFMISNESPVSAEIFFHRSCETIEGYTTMRFQAILRDWEAVPGVFHVNYASLDLKSTRHFTEDGMGKIFGILKGKLTIGNNLGSIAERADLGAYTDIRDAPLGESITHLGSAQTTPAGFSAEISFEVGFTIVTTPKFDMNLTYVNLTATFIASSGNSATGAGTYWLVNGTATYQYPCVYGQSITFGADIIVRMGEFHLDGFEVTAAMHCGVSGAEEPIATFTGRTTKPMAITSSVTVEPFNIEVNAYALASSANGSVTKWAFSGYVSGKITIGDRQGQGDTEIGTTAMYMFDTHDDSFRLAAKVEYVSDNVNASLSVGTSGGDTCKWTSADAIAGSVSIKAGDLIFAGEAVGEHMCGQAHKYRLELNLTDVQIPLGGATLWLSPVNVTANGYIPNYMTVPPPSPPPMPPSPDSPSADADAQAMMNSHYGGVRHLLGGSSGNGFSILTPADDYSADDYSSTSPGHYSSTSRTVNKGCRDATRDLRGLETMFPLSDPLKCGGLMRGWKLSRCTATSSHSKKYFPEVESPASQNIRLDPIAHCSPAEADNFAMTDADVENKCMYEIIEPTSGDSKVWWKDPDRKQGDEYPEQLKKGIDVLSDWDVRCDENKAMRALSVGTGAHGHYFQIQCCDFTQGGGDVVYKKTTAFQTLMARHTDATGTPGGDYNRGLEIFWDSWNRDRGIMCDDGYALQRFQMTKTLEEQDGSEDLGERWFTFTCVPLAQQPPPPSPSPPPFPPPAKWNELDWHVTVFGRGYIDFYGTAEQEQGELLKSLMGVVKFDLEAIIIDKQFQLQKMYVMVIIELIVPAAEVGPPREATLTFTYYFKYELASYTLDFN